MAKQFLDKTGLEALVSEIKDNFMKKATIPDNGNFNDYVEAGSYRYNSNPQNAPSGAGTHGQLLVVRGANDTIAQLCFPYGSSRVYLRTGNPVNNSSGSWHEWVELSNTGHNHDSVYVKKDGATEVKNLKFKASLFSNQGNYAMDLQNSDVIGANKITFADPLNSNEGLLFPRDGGKYDLLRVYNGKVILNVNCDNTDSDMGTAYNIATENFVTGKGYQTASQVNTLIDSKMPTFSFSNGVLTITTK